MRAKLRALFHFLLVLVGACALLWLGFIWLPSILIVIWILSVINVASWALLLLFWRPASDARNRRLARSSDHWIAGVCGGMAEFLDWQPGAVRACMVLSLLVATFGAILVYTVLAGVMPSPPPTRGGKFRLEDFRVQ